MGAKLLILGANNPELLRLIRDLNRSSGEGFDVQGWLDNDPAKHGCDILGLPVLGPPDILGRAEYRDCLVVNNITRDGKVRRETTRQLEKYGNPFARLVHPRVNLQGVELGQGVVVQEGALIQAGALIRDHAYLAGGSVVSHEAEIGPYAFVSSGATVAGFVKVGEAATIWAGATVAPRLSIGAEAVVGIGSVVVSDVEEGATVFGNPARAFPSGKRG